MPSRDNLIPLIGLRVEARYDKNRTIIKGTFVDVGTKYIFVQKSEGLRPGSIEKIELSNLSSIRYMKEENLRGPFDGRREEGDNRGG